MHRITNGTNVEDEALVRRARAGDRPAFSLLVDRYQAPVYRVVRGILADPAECEDVTQEVFLKAFANLSRFRGDARFFTWLYRIAVNEAFRARSRRTLPVTDALPEAEAPPREEIDPDAPSHAALQRLLGRLSDEHRAIVTLRDLEGLSYQEVAEALEIPIGTVESRLFRARRELRELWRQMKEKRHAL
jgi:RNA polymerase sigma-70 factor (ECF subfamily)